MSASFFLVSCLSGDSINKSDALIGLKENGKPELGYFKNTETLKQYYKLKHSNEVNNK